MSVIVSRMANECVGRVRCDGDDDRRAYRIRFRMCVRPTFFDRTELGNACPYGKTYTPRSMTASDEKSTATPLTLHSTRKHLLTGAYNVKCKFHASCTVGVCVSTCVSTWPCGVIFTSGRSFSEHVFSNFLSLPPPLLRENKHPSLFAYVKFYDISRKWIKPKTDGKFRVIRSS